MAAWLLPANLWRPLPEIPPKIKGFRIGGEARGYFFKSAPHGSYVSVEADYLSNRYRDKARFGESEAYLDTLGTNYVDTFSVRKETATFSLKWGYQIVVHRISLDFYFGLGARYKSVRHRDRRIPSDDMESPRHPNLPYMKNREGNYWTVAMPINFKIGYNF